jgi:hypothetical protein
MTTLRTADDERQASINPIPNIDLQDCKTNDKYTTPFNSLQIWNRCSLSVLL